MAAPLASLFESVRFMVRGLEDDRFTATVLPESLSGAQVFFFSFRHWSTTWGS